MTDMESTTKKVALKIVSWWWVEQFANEKYPSIAKQFIAEAKEAWAEEMIRRMNSGVFYGSGEEQT